MFFPLAHPLGIACFTLKSMDRSPSKRILHNWSLCNPRQNYGVSRIAGDCAELTFLTGR
jgi:hypothetical protein